MRIAAVQFCPKFKDVETNQNFIIQKSKEIDAELICYPEMALTGYFFVSREELEHYAFDFSSSIVKDIQEISTSQNKIILFGFPERKEKKIYNSCAILFPDAKQSKVYRKTHLFYRERFVFDPGNTGFFVDHYPDKDLFLGTMICYDWRFPESARVLALNGADLIACPSNLVTKIWHLAMPARAIENKVYLLVANRIGTETSGGETLIFNGKSGIWHYYGELIACANESDEQVVLAEILPQETRNKYIDKFNNLFKDRRPNFYDSLVKK